MGKYVASTGSTTACDCINCLAGKYSNSTGNGAEANCIACTAGRYLETPGGDEASDVSPASPAYFAPCLLYVPAYVVHRLRRGHIFGGICRRFEI
jgi:hypothetical protein